MIFRKKFKKIEIDNLELKERIDLLEYKVANPPKFQIGERVKMLSPVITGCDPLLNFNEFIVNDVVLKIDRETSFFRRGLIKGYHTEYVLVSIDDYLIKTVNEKGIIKTI